MKNIWQYQNNFYIENQSIPLVRCKGIAFPHGFSTRLGGVSTDKGYETLDLGAGEDTVLTEGKPPALFRITRNKPKISNFCKTDTFCQNGICHG